MMVTVPMNVTRAAGGSERAEPLVPEAQEQQRANRPLSHAKEPGRSLGAEDRVEPED